MPTRTNPASFLSSIFSVRGWLPVALTLTASILFLTGCGSKPPRRTGANSPDAPAADSETDGATDGASGQGRNPSGDGSTVSTNLVGDVEPGSLGPGKPAPKLQLSSWMKGEKVTSFEEGKVYVVEFWATWCAPCRESMPHLSELQTKYKDDVKIIGVSDETPGEVARFLQEEQVAGGKKWIDVITYAIALDDDQKTSVNYMLAANLEGIPNAFIVGKTGLVEWIGHPLGIDEPLAAVLDGTWDLEKAVKEHQLESEITVAVQEKETAIMKAHEAATAAAEKGDKAAAAEQFDVALATVDELLGLIPEDVRSAKLVGQRDRLNQAKQWLLSEAGRTEELQAFQKKLIDQYWENPQLLDAIAWSMTDQEDADLELGISAAKQAIKLSGSKEPSPMDTLAKLYSLQGNLDAAIEWQTKAVDAAASVPAMQKQLEAVLNDYKEAAKK